MTKGTMTTRLYDIQAQVAEKYLAWVRLQQNRKITKQDAVNELIVIGAQFILPKEILLEFGLEQQDVRE